MTSELNRKLENLKQYFKELGGVAVAFSGGVDSTFLLKVAHDVLGDKAIAITAQSQFIPNREMGEAIEFCQQEHIYHEICKINVLENESIAINPPDRCYLCKKEIFQNIIKRASEHQIEYVVDGSNMDDNNDYRPGMRALQELSIKSPLQIAEMTKADIRTLSKELELPTWHKPAFACLASRFVYGEKLTEEKLSMVERAEQLLLNLGFEQFRVRIHDKMARIEVLPEDFDRLMQKEIRETVQEKLTEYGFSYVTMDLKGYRTGSMNETLFQ